MLTLERLENIVRTLDTKKASEIKVLKITDLSSIADYFVIASGTSSTHVKSLAEEVEDKLASLGQEPRNIEGRSTGWILLDYEDVVCHVFTPDNRELFNLEKLWQDAEETDISAWLTED